MTFFVRLNGEFLSVKTMYVQNFEIMIYVFSCNIT